MKIINTNTEIKSVYYLDGTINERGTYLNGEMILYEIFKDGKLESVREYKNGLKHGFYTWYSKSGINLYYYKNDQQEGLTKVWFSGPTFTHFIK